MGTRASKVTTNREMTCSMCGKEKPDVHIRRDPYAYDVDNTEVLMALCDICTESRADDI